MKEVTYMPINLPGKKPDLSMNYRFKPKTVWDEIEMYNMLINTYSYSQKELCERFGLSQAGLSNKLRLNRLSPAVRAQLIKFGLSERHARALLVLKTEKEQFDMIDIIVQRNFTVAETEHYILQQGIESERRKVYRKISRARQLKNRDEEFRYLSLNVREIRLFVMSLKKSLRILERAGIDVRAGQRDRKDCFEFVVRIMKNDTGVEMKGA